LLIPAAIGMVIGFRLDRMIKRCFAKKFFTFR